MSAIWGNMTLGELIDELKKQPDDNEVYLDFCYMAPDGVESYRGFYDHLALSYSQLNPMKVKELREELEAAVGATFTGYKGGSFIMTRNTPMWIDNIGDASSTGVMSVNGESIYTIIKTTRLNV